MMNRIGSRLSRGKRLKQVQDLTGKQMLPSTPHPRLAPRSTPSPNSERGKDNRRLAGDEVFIKLSDHFLKAHQPPVLTRFGRSTLLTLITLFAVLLAGLPAVAQERAVTDDEVNAIAKQLYCPVCENIPLDVCPTLACQEWRNEIRTQLASGMNEQEVINDFVQRYGERVVGTPQDPTLRALSLVTPWLLGLVALLSAGYVLLRWRANPPQRASGTAADAGVKDDDYYRTRIEQDVVARR
jgi:cytochrome c-type biogenesis protein CcmH